MFGQKRIEQYAQLSNQLNAVEAAGRENARVLVEASDRIRESLCAIAKEEIASGDRVDIPLEKYESMQSEIASLEEKLHYLMHVLERSGIDPNWPIIPESVVVRRENDPIDLTEKVYIRLELDTIHSRKLHSIL